MIMPLFLAPIVAKLSTWFSGATVKLILIAVILAAVGGAYWYVHHLQNKVSELTQSAADARDAAASNLAQYQDLKAKADKMAAVISLLETERAARQVVLTQGRDAVAKAAALPGGDAPMAPSLKAALDALRVAP